jgi:hypothetical protein
MGVLDWLRGKRTESAVEATVGGTPASGDTAIVTGSTAFATALYRELAAQPNALFFSPSSICQFATPRDQPVAGSWGQGEDIGIGLDDARDRGACRGLRSRALRARRRISLLQGDGASLGPCKKVGPPPSSPPSILNPPPTTWPRGWTAARRCVREMGGEGPAIAKRRWALRISGGACSAGSRAACGARALDRPRGHRAWA